MQKPGVEYSEEEIKLFCKITISQQLREGIIEAHHVPFEPIAEDDPAATALIEKIISINKVPHPKDIHHYTMELYEDKKLCIAMMNHACQVMIDRLAADGVEIVRLDERALAEVASVKGSAKGTLH